MAIASKLTNEIIDFIYKQGSFAFRASSVGVYDQRLGLHRFAPKRGVADVLACVGGRFVAIEVKIGKDFLSSEQIGFLKNIEHYGGLSYVARDFESFKLWWSENLSTPQP